MPRRGETDDSPRDINVREGMECGVARAGNDEQGDEEMQSLKRPLHRRDFLRTMGGAGAAASLAPIAAPASAQQQPERTFRYTSLFAAGHPDYVASDYFAEQVAKYSGGKLRVNVFHNGSLGGDLDTVQAMRSGTIDMGRAGSAGVSTFIKDIRVLELPYLFKSLDEMRRSIQACTPVLRELFAQNNLELIGFQFDGPRMSLSSKPLKGLPDFKNLKMRAPEAPIFIEMLKAFGARPTPISLPELYMALQSGLVEALEGSAATLYTGKYYEVAKNLLRTDHIYSAVFLVVNSGVYASLSPVYQQAIRDAGRDATDMNLKLTAEGNVNYLEELKKRGVIENKTDLAPFVAAVQSFSSTYAKGIGGRAEELVEIIKRTSKA